MSVWAGKQSRMLPLILPYHLPPPCSRKIAELPTTPSRPNLISQFLIDQQGFDVDFGEHVLRMACSYVYCMWQILLIVES